MAVQVQNNYCGEVVVVELRGRGRKMIDFKFVEVGCLDGAPLQSFYGKQSRFSVSGSRRSLTLSNDGEACV